MIQAFATLFFLSSMKFIGAVNDSMFASYVVNVHNKVISVVTYTDPTVVLFSGRHLPAVILSVAIVAIIISPPVLLLILYPTVCFRKSASYSSNQGGFSR